MHGSDVVLTEALSKVYDGAAVVDAIDLAVPRNSIFGFLGPNGAGKTTTMKMLLGLIKPTSATGTVFDLDIVGDSAEVRRGSGICGRSDDGGRHVPTVLASPGGTSAATAIMRRWRSRCCSSPLPWASRRGL